MKSFVFESKMAGMFSTTIIAKRTNRLFMLQLLSFIQIAVQHIFAQTGDVNSKNLFLKKSKYFGYHIEIEALKPRSLFFPHHIKKHIKTKDKKYIKALKIKKTLKSYRR